MIVFRERSRRSRRKDECKGIYDSLLPLYLLPKKECVPDSKSLGIRRKKWIKARERRRKREGERGWKEQHKEISSDWGTESGRERKSCLFCHSFCQEFLLREKEEVESSKVVSLETTVEVEEQESMYSLAMDMKRSSLFIHLRSKYSKSSCSVSSAVSAPSSRTVKGFQAKEVQSEQVLYDCTWLNASSLLLILLYRKRRRENNSTT